MKRLTLLLVALLAFGAAPAHALDLFGKKDKAESASSGGDWRSPRFKGYDKNNDGKVSEEEFVFDQTEQFKKMDADKSGSLNPDEVDFAPGTPDTMKARMRKQMQEDEKRRVEMEEKMKIEQEKRMKEMQERMKADQEKAAKAMKDAAKNTPVAPAPKVEAPKLATPKVDAKATAPAPAPTPAKTPATTPETKAAPAAAPADAE